MLKYVAKLESVVEGKVGHFLLDHDTSLSVAKEMCLQFLKFLGQVEDAAKAQADQAASDAVKPAPEAPSIDHSTMPPEQPKSE